MRTRCNILILRLVLHAKNNLYVLIHQSINKNCFEIRRHGRWWSTITISNAQHSYTSIHLFKLHIIIIGIHIEISR